MLLRDTNVVIWLLTDDRRLGRRTRRLLLAPGTEPLRLSVITWWEMDMLIETRRSSLRRPANEIRKSLLGQGFTEQPLTGDIVIDANGLTSLPPDPADRFIVATARVLGATLLTSDGNILDWPGELRRGNAQA